MAEPSGVLPAARGSLGVEGGSRTARAIFPHLAGREITLDASKTFGVRRFTSDLPGDFGLRAVMGYLPERTER
jgi:hypothetical protein